MLLDAVHAYMDRSAIHFLGGRITGEVRRLEAAMGKHFVMIAESDLKKTIPRDREGRRGGRNGPTLNGATTFHHASVLRQSRRVERGTMRTSGLALPNWPNRFAAYLSTTPNYSEFVQRNHGRQVVGLSGHRFIGFGRTTIMSGQSRSGRRLTTRPALAGQSSRRAVAHCTLCAMLSRGEEFGASAPFL